MPNPTYGTPEDAPKPGPRDGIQDKPGASEPSWGSPGALGPNAPAPLPPRSRTPKPPISLTQIYRALPTWGKFSAWGAFLALCATPAAVGLSQYQPQEKVAACFMLPIDEIDELLGSEPEFDKDAIEGRTCDWKFEDDDAPGPAASLQLASFLSDPVDGTRREEEMDYAQERIAEGELESVEDVGTFATWDAEDQSLDWYDGVRAYELDLDGFVAWSDEESLAAAKRLAVTAMRNTESALAEIAGQEEYLTLPARPDAPGLLREP